MKFGENWFLISLYLISTLLFDCISTFVPE